MDRSPAPRSRLKIAFAFLSLLAAATITYSLWQALPQFRLLFDNFGGIPWPTRWVVEHPLRVRNGLCAVLAHNLGWLLIWLLIRARETRVGLTLATVLSWLSLAGLLGVLYLPMFSIAV